MDEQVIERKQCKQCQISFVITDKDEELLQNPTLCPDCRQQRRLARRNEKCLYHGVCDKTWKKMISLYSPDKKLKIFHYPERRKDDRDVMNYGRDFDFDKDFFSQFAELLQQVPKFSTYNKRTENTDYGNNVIEDKDCYLLFVTLGNQDCYYGFTMGYCKNCVDNLRTISCQNCYECTKTQNSYECFYCFNCHGCFSSQYLRDCIGVDSSAFCIWLRNKKYYFLNKPYAKSEFKEILLRLKEDPLFLSETKAAYEILKFQVPVNTNSIEQSENSSGDYLDNCKNCSNCFDTIMAEDCRYCYDTANASDNMDVYLWWAAFTRDTGSISYECENSFNSSAMFFCSCVTFQSDNVLYSDTCHCCKHCFGCAWLRNKEYCILNKQYTKEEYEKIVPKIIEHMQKTGEWWEFFPISMSVFGYNETQAQIYYPIDKEKAESQWRKRHDENKEIAIPEGIQAIYAKDLPNIQDVNDDILGKVIICEATGKPFKLIKQELDFYRKYDLPLPRKCFDQRHSERMKIKTPRKIFQRTCAKCSAEIETWYAPVRKEIVYCQSCYHKEVYG